MRALLLIGCATLLAGGLAARGILAAEPEGAVKAPAEAGGGGGKKLDLPGNDWVARKLSGFKGIRVSPQATGLQEGFLYVPEAEAILVLAQRGKLEQSSPPRAWALDLKAGKWSELPTKGKDFANIMRKGRFVEPVQLTGTQACYDPVSGTVVGLSTEGQTLELDMKTGTWSLIKAKPSPPGVTAGSLCYDPVNGEAVLATGGFSVVGGTDGCWLYDVSKHQWRRLEGPKEVDAVRLPLEKLLERVKALRWLAWKNLEFRSTDREKLLDERATGAKLSAEAAALAGQIKALGGLAAKNSGAAEREYHRKALASAAKLLEAAAARAASAELALKGGSPEQIEGLYRGALVPAQEEVEKALSEIAIHPEPRMSARVVYDSKHKVMVLFGGDRQDGLWGDTWVYHCEGRWWERRHPSAHPRPGTSRAFAFDPTGGTCVLVSEPTSRARNARREVWSYDAGRNEWKLLEAQAPRECVWLEHDPAAGCLVGFAEKLDAAWTVRLDASASRPAPARPAPEVELLPITGVYVLRDAVNLAELGRMKAAMEEFLKATPANTWALAPTHGTGRQHRGHTWSSIVYDPDRLQIYNRDGGHGNYQGAGTDHYDIPTGRWFRSDRREEPGWPMGGPMGGYFCWGRSFRMAPWAVHTYKYKLFYNPIVRRLQRLDGFGGLHDYDPDLGAWARAMYPVPDGGAPFSEPIVPGLPDGLACVKGWERYNVRNSDIWLKTPEGVKTWKAVGTLPQKHDLNAICVFADPVRRRIFFYGGHGGFSLHSFDLNKPDARWQRCDLTVEGGAAPPLPTREVVYVPEDDAFLLVDGKRVSPPQIWRLDAKTFKMRMLSLPAPEKRPGLESNQSDSGFQYDPVSRLCFFLRPNNPMWCFRYEPEKKAGQK